MAPIRHFIRLLSALVLVFLLAAPATAQTQSVRLIEQDIKAGLLYNFLRYTAWPPATRVDEAMIVCIYGDDPFEGRLEPMSGRTVNQRRILVRNVRNDRDLETCALLFINAEERADWPHLRSYLAGRSVLTVSDYDGFARSGGILEFTRINNRIGVRVNVVAAETANLSVQDRLLRLASVVRTGVQ
ncbi:MAG TPA: YfiR family protein [Verrucomicrobiae bacterium]|nr:YfiR family protein [Verrucomicrobiae bacterium]